MSIKPLRNFLISVALLSLPATYALAQSTPVDPATASESNPNPATSTTTDEEGNNPLAREGDHSPTGHNPPLQDVTVGSGSPPIDAQAKPGENSDGGGTGVPDDHGLPPKLAPDAPPLENSDGGGTGVPGR